ncbi:MAG: alpha/beta fold hydrolase [Pseudomonadales bacterium]
MLHDPLLRLAPVIPMTRSHSGQVPTAHRRVRGLHVTVTGTGPELLLLHGTAASGESWRHLLPALAQRCRVVVPDLPGHGRSADPGRHGYTPEAMTAALAAMLDVLQARPRLIVGHSAGAVLAASLLLDGAGDGAAMVAVAPAMLGFGGGRQTLFSGLAKLLAVNPLVPQLVAWRARDRQAVERLLRGIGADLNTGGVERYAALFRQPGHIAAVLKMMANWDLESLEQRLPQLGDRVLLITGGRDRAVPDAEIRRLQQRLPGAARVDVANAGHLVHEEKPYAVLNAMRTWAGGRGIDL